MNELIFLGKRIYLLRKKKNWSQEDLALESEINKNYISDLERGKRNPTIKVLTKISRALDVSLSHLFEGI